MSARVGAAVRQLRTAKGLTQSNLGDRAGLRQEAMSLLENGRRRADKEELARLARALRCRVDFLQDGGAADRSGSKPWLRAYADAPQQEVDQRLAVSELAIHTFDALQLEPVGTAVPPFDGDPRDPLQIEQHAQEVRAAARIGPGDVVMNAARAAERLRCLLLPMEGELGRHLGMSTVVDERDVIHIARPGPDLPGDRQRFTIAHELGHLALHRSESPPETPSEAKEIERQAHRFAAAFLAPGDAMMEELDARRGRLTLNTLLEIKATWGIAVRALVKRFADLGVADDHKARSLYKQISNRGWNTGEPVDVANEKALWVQQALERRFPQRNPVEAASDVVGLDVEYFLAWTDWTPMQRRGTAEVVDLASRRAASGSSTQSVQRAQE